jgi:hypothetical protein
MFNKPIQLLQNPQLLATSPEILGNNEFIPLTTRLIRFYTDFIQDV